MEYFCGERREERGERILHCADVTSSNPGSNFSHSSLLFISLLTPLSSLFHFSLLTPLSSLLFISLLFNFTLQRYGEFFIPEIAQIG